MLRDEGYHVPADVFEAIDEELAATTEPAKAEEA
jgi:hypothetical protein